MKYWEISRETLGPGLCSMTSVKVICNSIWNNNLQAEKNTKYYDRKYE